MKPRILILIMLTYAVTATSDISVKDPPSPPLVQNFRDGKADSSATSNTTLHRISRRSPSTTSRYLPPFQTTERYPSSPPKYSPPHKNPPGYLPPPSSSTPGYLPPPVSTPSYLPPPKSTPSYLPPPKDHPGICTECRPPTTCEPKVIVKKVEVIKTVEVNVPYEVIREVIKEVPVPVEVIREVIKYVEKPVVHVKLEEIIKLEKVPQTEIRYCAVGPGGPPVHPQSPPPPQKIPGYLPPHPDQLRCAPCPVCPGRIDGIPPPPATSWNSWHYQTFNN